MNPHALPLPVPWRGALDWTRAASGGIYLIVLLAANVPAAPAKTALLAAHLVFAVIRAVRRSSRANLGRPGAAILPLVADLVVFLSTLSDMAVIEPWLAVLFYSYILVNGALCYSWREVALAASCTAGIAILLPPAARDRLMLPVATIAAATLAVSLHNARVRNQMSLSLRQAVLYRAEAEQAREAERQRIAADFHDGPLQSFVGFQMRLEILRKLLERDVQSARAELTQLQELCRSQVTDLRAFVRSMRPVEVDGAGLSASVRRLVEGYHKDTGIVVEFQGDVAGPSEPDVVLEVLQIVRESLHNVRKHSRASRVTIALGTARQFLEISVSDNGAGFCFSGTFALDELELLRLGPASIMRRVRGLGGEFTLNSQPGQGSELRIRVPV